MVAPKPNPWLAVPPSPVVVNITDCFRRLPLELKEQIAAILSTKDVLNLRPASRAMGLLFESHLCWQTRFDINMERGFLVPLIKKLSVEERRNLDWRLLYHCTCNFRYSWTFRDTHIEMWERLRWLRDMTMEARLYDLESPCFFDGRALQHYHNTHYPQSRPVAIDIPHSLARINVSVLQNFSGWHLDKIPRDIDTAGTGLEFVYDDRPSMMVGHSTPGALVVTDTTPRSSIPKLSSTQFVPANLDYTYPKLVHEYEAKPLRGFHLWRAADHGMIANIHVIDKSLCYCFSERERLTTLVPPRRYYALKSSAELICLDKVDKVVITHDVSLIFRFYVSCVSRR
jgi:hypothetical protein